jgi:ascorbate-specific PTS system EIIC-type component UlaA
MVHQIKCASLSFFFFFFYFSLLVKGRRFTDLESIFVTMEIWSCDLLKKLVSHYVSY